MNILLYPTGLVININNNELRRLYKGKMNLTNFKTMLINECDPDDNTDEINNARNFIEAIYIFRRVSSYDTSEFNLLINYNENVAYQLFGGEVTRIFYDR